MLLNSTLPHTHRGPCPPGVTHTEANPPLCFAVLAFSRSVLSNSLQTPWTIAHQAPLSMGFLRQEYWSGLGCHFCLQGIFPTQGSNSSGLLQWQVGSLPLSPLGSPTHMKICATVPVIARKATQTPHDCSQDCLQTQGGMFMEVEPQSPTPPTSSPSPTESHNRATDTTDLMPQHSEKKKKSMQ